MRTHLALSGTCYWCMGAVFQSLKGVLSVEQGWAKSAANQPGCPSLNRFSSNSASEKYVEAVLVEIDDSVLPLDLAIDIHLSSHSCTKNHSLRERYPSAIYALNIRTLAAVQNTLSHYRREKNASVITHAAMLAAFYPSPIEQQGYFYRQPDKPFSQKTILPKLFVLARNFPESVSPDKAEIIFSQPASKMKYLK